jgi:nickel-dependent lactate racemase
MRKEETLIHLPYGNSFLDVKVPANNLSFILERKNTSVLDNEPAAIREALYSPIHSPHLSQGIGRNDKVVVLVTDNTRACPDEKLLPVILEAIEYKVPRRNITIVVALGLHPPLGRDTLVKKLGHNIVEKYDVRNHDPARTVHLGTTSRGNPVEIYQDVAQADFIISTGFIEPHFFAGFSGGSKSIAPGVSSKKAIYQNHSYKMVNDKRARAGILHGNPVHEDIVEQAKLAGLNFIVNVLLDKTGTITQVVAGDPVIAHEKGCELENALASATIDHEVDITIVTNGGAPLDLDLYQTCKGIDTAAQITRPGGIIIVASLCPAGLGPQAFYSLHASAGSPREVLERIKRDEPVGVQWQNQILARCQLEHKVYLMSSLNPAEVQGMMIHPVSSIEEGIGRALSALGRDVEIAVIPEGPHVLPFVA